jgi:hypothetical protein
MSAREFAQENGTVLCEDVLAGEVPPDEQGECFDPDE